MACGCLALGARVTVLLPSKSQRHPLPYVSQITIAFGDGVAAATAMGAIGRAAASAQDPIISSSGSILAILVLFQG